MSKTFKKIAVVLRGHVRTWNFVKEQNFHFFDSISDQVDYYLTTWDLPEYTDKKKSEIIDSFRGHNLIKAEFIERNPIYYATTIFKTSFLTIKILVDKVQQEKTGKYDAVFDTRPDVIIDLKKDQICQPLDEKTVYTVNSSLIDTPEGKKLFLEDYLFIMPSDAFDIFTQRHKIQRAYHNAQVGIGEHIEKLGYKNGDASWLNMSIVRPSILNLNLNPRDFFTSKMDVSNLNYPTWIKYSNEEKIAACQKFDIALEDYQTSGSHLIKIN